jgi:hypothetical protein
MKNPAQKASQQLPETKKWVEHFARFGYAAKGTIYVLVGTLSAIAAFGTGGKTAGRKGAFLEIAQQPYGKILLGIVALGFVGYGVWRFIQSVQDAENKGKDARGILIRVGYVLSGLLYLYFAYFAYQLISVSKSNQGGSKFLIAQILDWSAGQFLVGILSLIVLAKGIYQIYKVSSGVYKQDVKDSKMRNEIKKAYRTIGQFGLIARAVVFGIISFFLAKAALTSSATQAKGTSGVFRFLTDTGGPVLMGIIALGLLAYGIFEFVKARYKPFNVTG